MRRRLFTHLSNQNAMHERTKIHGLGEMQRGAFLVVLIKIHFILRKLQLLESFYLYWIKMYLLLTYLSWFCSLKAMKNVGPFFLNENCPIIWKYSWLFPLCPGKNLKFFNYLLSNMVLHFYAIFLIMHWSQNIFIHFITSHSRTTKERNVFW